MMPRSKNHRQTLLAAAICATGAVTSPAFAETAKEQALEARIAELERQLAELAAATKAKADAPRPPAAGTPAPIQATTITPGAHPGTVFTVGGMMRTEVLLTNTNGGEIPDSSAGRVLYVPGGIPVGAADEGTDLDAHIQFSRLWFGFDSTLAGGDKLSARAELDLFGSALGTEVATNTYGMTVRHAWFSWNGWLFGQTWSNYMDAAALPEAADLIGPTDGSVFVRQPMIRYTSGPWSVSLENPETTITPFRGGTRISSDDNNVPDLTVRYRYTRPWGHLTAGALLRQLKHQDPLRVPPIDDSTLALAGTVSGRYNFSANNDIRFALNFGQGIGRYVGIAIASDAVLDGRGQLEAIDGVAGFISFRHVFNPKLRANLWYAASHYENDTALTGLGVTKRVSSFTANLFHSPVPRLDLGVELRYGTRELESGVDGDLSRVHFIARYFF